ncbi:MAG: hypothetical protein CL609_22825 [Anaerolineaceae bacterium]|nr:hypothetical protein [Anaerolineaceae bacterium]
MSHVKEFHLMHGIVLTRILRNDSPTLRLVETDKSDAWAMYVLNDAVIVYVKYSICSRITKKEEKTVWSFPFQTSELKKISEKQQTQPVYFALVCGFPAINEAKKMQVCLLEPLDINKCIDFNLEKPQVITVELITRASLRAYGPKNPLKKLVVSRNKLDEWEIPGS